MTLRWCCCLLICSCLLILSVSVTLQGSFYACRVICPTGEIGLGGDNEFCSGENWLASNVGLRLDPKTIMSELYVNDRYLNKEWCIANGDLLNSASLDKSITGFHFVGYVPSGNDTYPYEAISTSEFHETLGQNFTTDFLNASLPARNGGFVIYHEWVNKVMRCD